MVIISMELNRMGNCGMKYEEAGKNEAKEEEICKCD